MGYETANNVDVTGLLLDQLYSVAAATEVRLHGLIYACFLMFLSFLCVKILRFQDSNMLMVAF